MPDNIRKTKSWLFLGLYTAENAKIFRNFSYLGIIQASNFLLPLVVLPHMITTFGTEKFGVLNVSMAIVAFFTIITDYGFNLVGTKEIAINAHDKDQLCKIYSAIMVCKLILVFICSLLYLFCFFNINVFIQEKKLFSFGYFSVLTSAFFPIWFFQGMEKMGVISVINVSTKLISTVLILTLIKSDSDYVYIHLYNSAGNLLAIISGVIMIKYRFKINFTWPSFPLLTQMFRNGWLVFISNFMICIYINSNIIILNMFATKSRVGYYSIAEKIISAIKQIINVLFQAIYPHACKLSTKGIDSFRTFFRGIFIINLIGFSVIGIVLYFYSDELIFLISGKNIPEASKLLKIMAFIPVTIASCMSAFQTLIILNLNKYYTIVLAIASLISLLSNYILANHFNEIGTAISVLLVEIFVTIGLNSILILKGGEYSFIRISK